MPGAGADVDIDEASGDRALGELAEQARRRAGCIGHADRELEHQSICTCIEGVGKGGEYFRALHANSGTDPVIESLITPAAIYDIGSVMVINTGQELSYIRLTKLIETTNSFSQFAFEPTHPPESEVEKITSIKTMRL